MGHIIVILRSCTNIKLVAILTYDDIIGDLFCRNIRTPRPHHQVLIRHTTLLLLPAPLHLLLMNSSSIAHRAAVLLLPRSPVDNATALAHHLLLVLEVGRQLVEVQLFCILHIV